MVKVPSCPGDCLLPARLDQLHLVSELCVVLGPGHERRGQPDPVAAGPHDLHRRDRIRTPAARRRNPGAGIGDRHIADMAVTDRFDVSDVLPGYELAVVAADLDPLGRQPGTEVAAPRADS